MYQKLKIKLDADEADQPYIWLVWHLDILKQDIQLIAACSSEAVAKRYVHTGREEAKAHGTERTDRFKIECAPLDHLFGHRGI